MINIKVFLPYKIIHQCKKKKKSVLPREERLKGSDKSKVLQLKQAAMQLGTRNITILRSFM